MTHTPVLLKEVVEGMKVKKAGLYIDATVGEGGHLMTLAAKCAWVLGIDRDHNQIDRISELTKTQDNIKLATGNFAEIRKIAADNDFFPVDGVLLDLGISMRQIKLGGLGFSYKNHSEALDMKFDKQETGPTASDLLNSLEKDQLYEIFAKYSEEINSMAIAEAIVLTRTVKKITKVGELVSLINNTVKNWDNMTLARIFQALRIAVNSEFDNLEKGLEGALSLLKPDGRIAVISFHSGEDRIVKNFIRKQKLHEEKLIKGSPNRPYERSAKLRIFWK